MSVLITLRWGNIPQASQESFKLLRKIMTTQNFEASVQQKTSSIKMKREAKGWEKKIYKHTKQAWF